MTATAQTTDLATSRRDTAARAVCALGAAIPVATVVLVGDTLGTGTAEQVTQRLVDSAVRLQVAGIVAVVAGAALLLAAARVGRRLGGMTGVVAGGAGAFVALLLTAYYATFAAGALVGSVLLDGVGGGLAESTLVVLNVVEMTRFAPGLMLGVAAFVARSRLPRPLAWSAAALAFLTLVPFTAWIAAILLPVWLGAAGALRDED